MQGEGEKRRNGMAYGGMDGYICAIRKISILNRSCVVRFLCDENGSCVCVYQDRLVLVNIVWYDMWK